jgi:O-antigen ligase
MRLTAVSAWSLIAFFAVASWTPVWLTISPWLYLCLLGPLLFTVAMTQPRVVRPTVVMLPPLLLVAIYAWNPSHRWVPGIGLLPVEESWFALPASAHAPDTWAVTVILAVAIIVFILASSLSAARAQRTLLLGMVLCGGAMAVWAVHQRVEYRDFRVFPLTGAFAYENHYATYANLLFPLALAAAARYRYHAWQEGQTSSPAAMLYVVAVLLAGSVLVSGARVGSLLIGLTLAAWFAQAFLVSRRYAHVKPRLRALPARWMRPALLLGGVVLLGLWWRQGWGAWDTFRSEAMFRGAILRDTLSLWQDRPWWGVGPGTFGVVFPYYQSAVPADVQVLHAHCEPLQMLAEWGVGGVLLLVACMVGAFALMRGNGETAKNDAWPTFGELEGAGILLGIGAVLLHSLVDFPFREPAILWGSAMLAGLCASRVRFGKGSVGR